MFKIALDAGHGLSTSGKQTPDGIKEWTLNDKVRDKVVALLSDYDCEIINVDNNEGAVDESLTKRVQTYINAKADAFVSIHHNAYTGSWNNATGVEVYTDNNPTAKDSALANSIYDRLVRYTGLRGRGVKRAAYTVINQNTIPAVLIEGGFMDGTNDYKVITSDSGQTAYAKAVAEGLVEFLGLKKKQTGPTWIKDSKGWWYRHADGSYTKNGWERIGSEWYYFEADGYAVKENSWKLIGNRWYYFDARNVAVKGLHNIGGKLFLFADKEEGGLKECQLIITNSNGEIQPTV